LVFLFWIATRGKNMKRILLTTTSLVLAAGVAQADVSFSGTTGVALIDDNGVSDATRVDMFFESYYDFDITASAESDNGVSVSVGLDLGGGNKIDYNDDDKLEAQGGTATDADVAVSYAGWTVTVDQAGIDNLFDDDYGSQDVSIAGSIAGWSVAMTSDQEGSTSSYKVSGNVAGVALTITGTDVKAAGGDASKVAASYNMGNGLTLSASSQDEDGTAEDDATVGFSYAMDALTVGYTSIQPGGKSFGDEWDLSLKYSAGATVASFAIDEADATTIIADYALGGGASAFAAMHDKAGTGNDLTTVGLNFAF
jgi:outer membrane protein OmpU